MGRSASLALVPALALSVVAGVATADGPPTPAPVVQPSPAPPFTWTGLYLGTHSGGALDESDVSNPYGPTLFGDDVRSPGALGGGQIGYNKQFGAWVVGVEADVSWADLDGQFTCLQPSRAVPGLEPTFVGGAFGATCRVQVDWLGTFTGRIGTAMGPEGRLLVYAKGGAAWMHADVDLAGNNSMAGELGPPISRASTSFTQWGWTVGGGLEYALTPNLSARVEYDFLSFGDRDIPTPSASPVAAPDFPGVLGASILDGRTAQVNQDVHAVKLGLNYKLGDGPDLGLGTWLAAWPAALLPAGPIQSGRALEVEVGGRYVHGWGRFQANLGRVGEPRVVNNSRLTWHDLETDGGEVFWRVDTPHRLMIKGLWGGGNGNSGHIDDEDWGLPDPDVDPALVRAYQVTESSADSRLHYLTIDVGYNWFMGAGYKISPFVGYNRYENDMDAFGLTFRNFVPPPPPGPEERPNVIPLQERTTWDSLRLGTAFDLWLTPRLRLSADAAWLPYVNFSGVDVHPLRPDAIPSNRSPQQGDAGQGVQLEATLSYNLTDQFSVGVGGRYWAMQVDGKTNFFSSGELIPERYAAEQAALFVQGSYKFDAPCCGWLPFP